MITINNTHFEELVTSSNPIDDEIIRGLIDAYHFGGTVTENMISFHRLSSGSVEMSKKGQRAGILVPAEIIRHLEQTIKERSRNC
ncbi:MAG: hypothetical protein WC623_22325 [Pedobacter sp.]|uniref:hypothetical protein n=1 Tax=Pedobacter sp. TaxID=1411316 RepID=UPI003562C1AA